ALTASALTRTAQHPIYPWQKVVTVNYNAVEKLNVNAGAGNDRFAVQSVPSDTSVAFDGGSGANTLDYSAYVGDLLVDLPLGSATALAGGIKNIQNVTGSQGNDLS